MADAGSSIFNKKATEKLRSPDDLDKYVRVTNPSVWVVLAACVILLFGLLAWGVFGTVSTSVSGSGTVVGGNLVCFLSADDVSKVHEGDAAYVGGSQAQVKDVAKTPMSLDEVRAFLQSDYLVSELVDGDWAYPVVFSCDEKLEEGVPFKLNITTERIAPISLVLGSQG